MLLTPSTSNREMVAGIKSYHKKYIGDASSMSSKKTAKLFDYLDLKNGFNEKGT